MSGEVFIKLLPSHLIQLINSLLQPTHSQIVASIQHLLQNQKFSMLKFINKYWSKQIILDYPQYEIKGFNFAVFIQTIMAHQVDISPHSFDLEQLIINMIMSNPDILSNRFFYNHKGQKVGCILIEIFTKSRNEANCILRRRSNINESLFQRVLCCIMANHLYKENYFISGVFEGHWLQMKSTNQHFIQQMFHYGLKTCLWQPQDYYQSLSLTKFFKALLQDPSQYFHNLHSKLDYNPSFYETIIKDLAQNKSESIRKQFLIFFLTRSIFHQQYFQIIVQLLAKQINISKIKLLLAILPQEHLKKWIITNTFIFLAITFKRFKVVEYLLDVSPFQQVFVEFREEILCLKLNDVNILEHTCQMRGITHKLILKLWATNAFIQMPEIICSSSKIRVFQQINYQFK